MATSCAGDGVVRTIEPPVPVTFNVVGRTLSMAVTPPAATGMERVMARAVGLRVVRRRRRHGRGPAVVEADVGVEVVRAGGEVATIPWMVRNSFRMVRNSSCMVGTQLQMVSSQSCWVRTQFGMVRTRSCWHPSQFWMFWNISRMVRYHPWMGRNSFRMVRNIQNGSRPVFQEVATIQKMFGTIRSVQNTYTN